jgi:cellulose synthase/poly-beta-1,6-N-acetylglucosamine synthase-like glycosyltransferase
MLLWAILGTLTILYSAATWLFFAGLGKLRRGANTTTPPVSVVLAARNESVHIRACLESLLAQSYGGHFDITVADDQSSDATADIVSRLAERHENLTLIRIAETPRGWAPKKHALQQAIDSTSGEIILATDADCILPTGWIAGLMRQFEPSVGMVVGFVQISRSSPSASLWNRLQALEFLSLLTAAAGGIGSSLIHSAMGGSLAYRREAFREIGGFERIKHLVSGDDDLLLQRLVTDTKWRVRFSAAQDTFATTEPMPDVKAFFRQRRRWASKAVHQRPVTFFFLLVTFLLNLFLLMTIPTTLVWGRSAAAPLLCLALKCLSEFVLLYRGARMFGRTDLLRLFPLWEIGHIPYVVISGLAGLRGGLSWKGRRYRGQDQTKKEPAP